MYIFFSEKYGFTLRRQKASQQKILVGIAAGVVSDFAKKKLIVSRWL